MKIEGVEYRIASEIRLSDGDKPKIVGYAAVFEKLSELLGIGDFREKIAKGAFAETIINDDIRALVDHDSSRILGRNKAGTLVLREDDTGLMSEIMPPDTTIGRDIVQSIKRGDITGMSFGFRTISDIWETIDGIAIRTLRKVQLFDVSPVTFPAYPDTSVAVRSLEQWKKETEIIRPSAVESMRMRLELEQVES
ncbi:MAG: HK97 family phage prohead protease [Phycisphaerae bacterium]